MLKTCVSLIIKDKFFTIFIAQVIHITFKLFDDINMQSDCNTLFNITAPKIQKITILYEGFFILVKVL